MKHTKRKFQSPIPIPIQSPEASWLFKGWLRVGMLDNWCWVQHDSLFFHSDHSFLNNNRSKYLWTFDFHYQFPYSRPASTNSFHSALCLPREITNAYVVGATWAWTVKTRNEWNLSFYYTFWILRTLVTISRISLCYILNCWDVRSLYLKRTVKEDLNWWGWSKNMWK